MLELILFIAIIVLDQVSKALCAMWLPSLPNQAFPLIDGVFELAYVENRGAAFGMLQNARWLLIALTVIVCGAMIWFLIKKRKDLHGMLRVCIVLIVAGAVGNLIDRLFLGYVRDMFYFSLINFAVFNVADASITIGGTLLVIDLLFSKKGRAFFAQLDQKKPQETPEKPSACGPTTGVPTQEQDEVKQ